MNLTFYGAAGEVTGSCYLLEAAGSRILLECGLIQGSPRDEARNAEPFPFDPASLDAVILSHSHIDHSGRIPYLVKCGYSGPVYTHRASVDLCEIMLRDSGFIQEKMLSGRTVGVNEKVWTWLSRSIPPEKRNTPSGRLWRLNMISQKIFCQIFN